MDHLLYLTSLRQEMPLGLGPVAVGPTGHNTPGAVHHFARRLSRASGSNGRGSKDAEQPAHQGLVSQLVESPLCKREASGSNPDESTPFAVVARGDLDLEKGPLNSTSATHPHGWVAGTPRRPTDN